ncbi:MAG: hypothetical protein IJC83_01550 [Oscillospiraceae bacterium]|nr:hypothetical protein [Oscillospiraceae bacterium]
MTVTGISYEDEIVNLGSPLNFNLASAFNAPADLLTMRFLKSDQIAELHSVSVYENGKLIFGGYVDEQTYIKDEDGCFLELVCRSPSAILLDNEAYPTTYYKLTNHDVYNIFLKPFRSFKGFLTDFDTQLSVFTVPKGMSVWEAVELFCFLAYKSRPFVTKDGFVDARKVKSNKMLTISNQRDDAISYSSLSMSIRRCEVISDVLIRSKSGKYSSLATNPAHREVYRRRFLNPGSEWSYYPIDNARQIIDNSMMRREVIEVTVPRILDVGLYDMVTIIDSAGSVDDVFVGEYSISIDKNGYKTNLSLYYKKFT